MYLVTCTGDGFPSPSFSLKHDGQAIATSRVKKQVIYGLVIDANVTCEANSKMGKTDSHLVVTDQKDETDETGPTLAKKLTSWNTCVESKSGLKLNDATTSIPERVKGMDSSNSVVLHLGTNDIDLTNESDLAAKYSHLIRKIRSSAPDCSVVVTAVANQLHPGSVNTNQKIDTLNNSLRSTCNLDNKCYFVNCNPPVKESFYKRDGFHFNYKGSHFFADCLTRFFMNKSNFLKTPNPTYT